MEEEMERVETQEQSLPSMDNADQPSNVSGRNAPSQINSPVSSRMDLTTESVQQAISSTKGPPTAPTETRTLSHALLLPSTKANAFIRYVMTAVAILLIVAAFLSIVTASQYRFLLMCVWMILFVFFIGFCYFIQETVINDSSRRRRQIFHPAVHALGDWIASGVRNFVEDCQGEYAVLLLSNEAAYDQYRQFDSTTTQSDTDGLRRTRPRTRLFRVVVQPIMNVAFWRRRKHRRQKQNMPQQDATAGNTAEYAPPVTTVV